MLTIMITCVCFTALFILVCLAGVICFIQRHTENLMHIAVAILVAFFISYFTLDFTFEMLSEIYKLPPLFWEWN